MSRLQVWATFLIVGAAYNVLAYAVGFKAPFNAFDDWWAGATFSGGALLTHYHLRFGVRWS